MAFPNAEGHDVPLLVSCTSFVLSQYALHGLIDMASYDQYFAGNLVNYELKDEEIQKNLDEVSNI